MGERHVRCPECGRHALWWLAPDVVDCVACGLVPVGDAIDFLDEIYGDCDDLPDATREA